MNAGARMTRPARRAQLLETAAAIVHEEGTKALTLAYLADRAGVTKPITYGHFGTRAGLLVALYRDLDERQTLAMRAALAEGGTDVAATAAILAAAFVDCVIAVGPAFTAIADALSASEETEALRRDLVCTYIDEVARAFAAHDALPPDPTAVFTGLLGAAEALAREAALGRMARERAIAALTRILLGAVSVP